MSVDVYDTNAAGEEEYVPAVIRLARTGSQSCRHPFRIQLSMGHGAASCPCITSGYERNTCGTCVCCPRCLEQWKPDTMPRAPHGPTGDYDRFPDVYIADVFYKPWYRRTAYADGAVAACMTEDAALAGLDALERAYPTVAAWITLYPIHVALYMKWTRMAARLAGWMTRRALYFTPGGVYAHMSMHLTRADIAETPMYNHGDQFAREALEGDHNIAYFLHARDSQYSNINLSNVDLFISRWLQQCKDASVKEELIQLFGYIWASSTRHWCVLEGESFYSDTVRRALRRVAHNSSGVATIMRIAHWQRVDQRGYLWHSTRTQCGMCRLHADETARNAAMFRPNEGAASAYERVLVYADALRRRRLWGVLFCAARLLSKARAVHYVPGIGSAYKEAAARFAVLTAV
jgi:hypothetical protein